VNQTLQQSGVALPVGHELLWYEIRSVLGHGGFGITYLAHDKNLGRDVALKEYLPRAWADRQSDFNVAPLDAEYDELYRKGLSSFMTEARTLAKFKHPNIVQVLAVFEQHDTAYIAMEYELGGSLTALLKSGQFVASEESLKGILMPVIDGLQNVHDMGFLHRDIKPSNLYVRDDNSPVLIDFGSSRQTGQLNTSDVTILITQGYTPAEQYSKGFGNQGPWTDIYSLAASAYHAISGRVVTDALQRNAAAQSGQPDPFKPLTIHDFPTYSEPFLIAVNDALSVKPEDRPQTLSEWRGMLEGRPASDTHTSAEEFLEDDRTILHTLGESPEVDDPTVLHNPLTPAQEEASSNQPPTEHASPTEVVTVVVEPKAETSKSTKTIEQPILGNEAPPMPATAAKKPSRLFVAGLTLTALLASGAYLFLANQSTNDAAPTAVPTTVNAVSPEVLLDEEIQLMAEQLTKHKSTLKKNSNDAGALAAINEIANKLTLLANSQIVQKNTALSEQVADGLVNSIGVNSTTQDMIINLIQSQSARAEESLDVLLAGTVSSTTEREQHFFGLAFASTEAKQDILGTVGYNQLMEHIYSKIDQSIESGQLRQATRMIELALLLSPEDQKLRSYVN
jgi:serine/threonine protein kinase